MLGSRSMRIGQISNEVIEDLRLLQDVYLQRHGPGAALAEGQREIHEGTKDKGAGDHSAQGQTLLAT